MGSSSPGRPGPSRPAGGTAPSHLARRGPGPARVGRPAWPPPWPRRMRASRRSAGPGAGS
jgi:hypothetical protein